MSRLKSFVLIIGALVIAGHSLVPPWVELSHRSSPSGASWTVTRPLGSYELWAPPTSERGTIQIDYGRLALYYVGTLAMVVLFLVWPRRQRPTERSEHGGPPTP